MGALTGEATWKMPLDLDWDRNDGKIFLRNEGLSHMISSWFSFDLPDYTLIAKHKSELQQPQIGLAFLNIHLCMKHVINHADFYDVLMKFDRKIIGFEFKIAQRIRKSINKVGSACDLCNPHKSASP